jgi:hypothetical protein
MIRIACFWCDQTARTSEHGAHRTPEAWAHGAQAPGANLVKSKQRLLWPIPAGHQNACQKCAGIYAAQDAYGRHSSGCHLLLLHISDVHPLSSGCDSFEMLYIAVVWMCALTVDSFATQSKTIGCRRKWIVSPDLTKHVTCMLPKTGTTIVVLCTFCPPSPCNAPGSRPRASASTTRSLVGKAVFNYKYTLLYGTLSHRSCPT